MVNIPSNGKAERLDVSEGFVAVGRVPFRREMNAAMSRFLQIELQVGQTFAKAAINARWTRESLHNRRLARKAYDTTKRLMDAKLTKAKSRKISKQLEILKLMLSQLGDPL